MPSNAYQYQAAKLKEIKNTLQNVLDNFQEHPEQIAELMAFKSQFYNYSMNNTALIHRQNPGATYVASFQDWKKKGYHVLKGQHGMKVLFPIRTELIEIGKKDGKRQYRRVADATEEEKRRIALGELKPVTFTRFGIGTVFDIAQTDCPPEKYPEFFHMGYSSEQHAALYRAVESYAERKGFHVRETDLRSISLRGDFTPATGEIRINDKLNDTEKLSTLTHELGHALMHSSKEAFHLPEPVMELEADCISIMLQRYVGLELTDTRKRHFVQNYNACKGIRDFKIENVLKDVNLAYYSLHQGLEPIFDYTVPNKKPEQNFSASRPAPAKKEVRLEDLAVGQKYYDKELDDSWHDDEIRTAYDAVNESKAYGGTPEYGPPMSAREIKNMFDEINNHREIVKISRIYQEDGKTFIDTLEYGEISAKEFLERINNGKAILEPDSPEQHSEHETSVPKLQKEPERHHMEDQDNAVLDHIKYGVSILALAKDMGFTPKQIGNYYTLKEHDSVRIYPETNSYYQFSAGTGGSPIDFVMHLGGCGREEAIRRLKEQYVGSCPASLPMVSEKPKPLKQEKKEFVLPEKVHGKYSHAFAYLVKTRGLDSAIVGTCIKDGLIYEDNKHNVVFVGKDKNGKSAFATRHTSLTGSTFKRDVAGSRQDIGWLAGNTKAQKLYVCEAPIDALSIMTLMKHQQKPLEKFAYLATCGTGKDKALYARLRENPQIREVVLANDRDEAGQKANQHIYETLKQDFPIIKVKLLNPNNGKDINECLCKKRPKGKTQEQEVER